MEAGTAQGVIDALLPESDDDFQYEEVEVLSEEDDDISEDFDGALRKLQTLSAKDASTRTPPAGSGPSAPGQVSRKQEVVDDFIRNFLTRMGMMRTVETFEAEWYELKATGRLDSGLSTVPDVYQKNLELENEVANLKEELQQAKDLAGKASSTWDKFKKERDFHRMHHKRVVQEKNKLIGDIKRLRDHFGKYEPTILELKKKYEAAMKEKMLISIDRNRLQSKLDALEASSPGPAPTMKATSRETSSPARSPAKVPPDTKVTNQNKTTGKLPPWPASPRKNPHEAQDYPAVPFATFSLQNTFKGHSMSVSNLALHPSKPILVTSSDDKTWKMWHLPAGDLIMCGEGHKDWVAGIDFHPAGSSLATASGDGTVKIWSFERQRCVATLTDHQQAVWSVHHHDTGELLASSSLDHSVRVWDLREGRCRQILRGHVDSVNEVQWQEYTNHLCSASSDKTVSIWDARSNLCAQTFYGHRNSCNSATFNLTSTMIASGDADGIVKLWDVRMVAELLTINTGPFPANKGMFDNSGKVFVVACDDGRIRGYNTRTGELITELVGHEEPAQACAFDKSNHLLVSVGSDNTFRLWS